MRSLSSNFLLMLLATFAATVVAQSVLLSSVGTLTFSHDRVTTGRRSSPVPQMQCVSGCDVAYMPKTAQCKNEGRGEVDVQWKCTVLPNLPQGVTLGTTEVSCEGFAFPEDPYILVGSCGLEYSLIRDATYRPPAPRPSPTPVSTTTTTTTTATVVRPVVVSPVVHPVVMHPIAFDLSPLGFMLFMFAAAVSIRIFC